MIATRTLKRVNMNLCYLEINGAYGSSKYQNNLLVRCDQQEYQVGLKILQSANGLFKTVLEGYFSENSCFKGSWPIESKGLNRFFLKIS